MKSSNISKTNKKEFLILLTVCLSGFLMTLDYGLVNISLPIIATHFHVSINVVARLPLFFLLIITSSLMSFGKLADIVGHKKIFSIGTIIFFIGAFLSASSTSIFMLLLFRILQAFGQAMYSPTGLSLITIFLPKEKQGKALGFLATSQGIGLFLGPFLGGFINTYLNWNAIFLATVPISFLSLLLSFYLPKKEKHEKHAFDLIGAFLLFLLLSTLLFVVNSIAKRGWNDPLILAFSIVFLISLILFLVREFYYKEPLVNLALFKNRFFTFPNLAAFCVYAMYFGTLFIFPFYFQLINGISPKHSGLLVMIPAIAMSITSPIAGKLADRFGVDKVSFYSLFFSIASFILLLLLNPEKNFLTEIIAFIFLGVSIGAFLSANPKQVLNEVPLDKKGMGSGVLKIIMNTGSIIGIAMYTLVVSQTIYSIINERHIPAPQIAKSSHLLAVGFRSSFFLGLALSVFALVFLFFGRKKSRV